MTKKKLQAVSAFLLVMVMTIQPIFAVSSSNEIVYDFVKANPRLFDDGDVNAPILDGEWIYYLCESIERLMRLGIPRKVSLDGNRTREPLSNQEAFLHSRFEKVGDYLYYSIATENKFNVTTRVLALYRVKTDGSQEGIVVPVYDYEIYKNKVYYQNPEDTKNHAAMYYSADLDGSNVTKLSDSAVDIICIYHDRIYYKPLDDDPTHSTVYSMKLDGSDVRKESYFLHDYIHKFTNNYHLEKLGQNVNRVIEGIDKSKKHFRSSTWGMTVAEVLEAEGIENPFTHDWIWANTTLYGKEVNLEFNFDNENKLKGAGYRFSTFSEADVNNFFKKCNEELVKKYGDPTVKANNSYQWHLDDTMIWLRIIKNLDNGIFDFLLTYHRIDKEPEYKNKPEPLLISSTGDKKNNLNLLEQHLQYSNLDEGWIYYSELKDHSTQDIIVSSEDTIHADMDAVISIQHLGKEDSIIRDTLKETLRFYLPKDYLKVYEIVEGSYPNEKVKDHYAFKNFDTNIRHLLDDILQENYVPLEENNPYLNQEFTFGNRRVTFKVNNKYKIFEIYIGKSK